MSTKPVKWVYRDFTEKDKIPEDSILNRIDPVLQEMYPSIGDFYKRRAYLTPHLELPFGDRNLAFYQPGVDLICKFIDDKIPIHVWGDYDVDGTTATSILVRCLETAGALVSWGIPSRMDQGYGVHVDSIRGKLLKGGLLVTVDNGISNKKEIAELTRAGYQVLVTDHHLPVEDIPECTIVNPKYGMDPSEDEYMASGAYVASMVGLNVLKRYISADSETYDSIFRLACTLTMLSVFSDFIPLNRTMRNLARFGLSELRLLKHAGLNALLSSSGVTAGQDITSMFLSFRFLPKLNAAGRMGVPYRCAELMMQDVDDTINQTEAMCLARALESLNKDRKTIENEIMKEAKVQAEILLKKYPHSLVVASNKWHEGVLGIVASRLVDIYHVPAVVLGGEKELLHGSGRSIPDFDLHGAFKQCEERLSRFGGHKNAAGLALATSELEGFRQQFDDIAKNTEHGSEVIITVDFDVDLMMMYDTRFHMLLKSMEPFGNEHPDLVFRLPPGLSVVQCEERRGALAMLLSNDRGNIIVVTRFRAPVEYYSFYGKSVEAFVQPSFTFYGGSTSIEWRLVHIQEYTGGDAVML